MTRRKTVWTIASVIVVFFSAMLWACLRRSDSDDLQRFIESRYANEIGRIESEMLDMQPIQADNHRALFDKSEALRPVFDAPEFFYVDWNHDGHHGIYSIKSMPTGFSHSTPWLFKPDRSKLQHRLYRGSSFNGDPLLVYQGWLPHSHEMREYNLVFYEGKVLALMKSQK